MKIQHKRTIRRWLPGVAMGLAGMIGGYLYYRFVGCASGTCAITSNPWLSVLYAGCLGGLLGYIITPQAKKSEHQNSSDMDHS